MSQTSRYLTNLTEICNLSYRYQTDHLYSLFNSIQEETVAKAQVFAVYCVYHWLYN